MADDPEIELPVLSDGVRSGVTELLPVQVVGPNRYRLAASPGLVEGLAAGDEIELAPEAARGYLLRQAGGNLCVWVFFSAPETELAFAVEQLSERVRQLGGWLDGGTAQSLIFTIPDAVGLPRLEEVFHQAEREGLIPGWMYGHRGAPPPSG
jgi:hypothetical protein